MDQPLTDAGNTQLIVAALLGIAAVVVLIVWAKMHPFLALMLGTAVMGGVAGVAYWTSSRASPSASATPWGRSAC